MSEVKVNKISPRSGTTVTLGDSGDTFTIPSGATINNQGTATNFGATGAASWTTTVKTGDFTATAGEGYFVDTTSGEVDVTLPAGTAGAVVAVKDYANTWDTNNCVIISNGSEKIGGSTNNAILSTEGLSVTLIYIDSTRGWLVTDDGLQSVADTNPYIEATGGTESTSGNCKIHIFTGPGTFSVTKTAAAAADNVVSHLVIAGGAGGGGAENNGSGGGGGGAGGYREVVSPSSPYTGSPLNGYSCSPNRVTVTATDFPITVGGGGSGGAAGNNRGVSGSNSSFSTITSAGGGAGGTKTNCEPAKNPTPGGSGGGGVANTGCGLPLRLGNQPPTSPAQGNPGGSNNVSDSGGGGGGASAAGSNANTPSPNQGGLGGAGTTSCITASPVARAGGGGGGNYLPAPQGTGGTGGGGNGGRNTPGTGGTDNTGSGGGGSGSQGGGDESGGNGGSGTIIIRYRYQ
jgi:hypothetical protein